MKEIADGKIHILDDEWAYILIFDTNSLQDFDIYELREIFLKKYVDYLIITQSKSGEFNFIHKKNENLVLPFRESFALKFQRTIGDYEKYVFEELKQEQLKKFDEKLKKEAWEKYPIHMFLNQQAIKDL